MMLQGPWEDLVQEDLLDLLLRKVPDKLCTPQGYRSGDGSGSLVLHDIGFFTTIFLNDQRI